MNRAKPPKLPLKFFRWFCHPKMQDYIEGDLMECYGKHLTEFGKRKANLKFIIDVLLLFRPGIIKPSKGYKEINNNDMLRNYFKTAWRNLASSKFYSGLNLLGL